MGDEYGECCKIHSNLGNNVDGCQSFRGLRDQGCSNCKCLMGFHKKIVPPAKYKTVIVYTKCQKNHDRTVPNSVDGCQEFSPKYSTDICEMCNCNKSFHRNEITFQV